MTKGGEDWAEAGQKENKDQTTCFPGEEEEMVAVKDIVKIGWGVNTQLFL